MKKIPHVINSKWSIIQEIKHNRQWKQGKHCKRIDCYSQPSFGKLRCSHPNTTAITSGESRPVCMHRCRNHVGSSPVPVLIFKLSFSWKRRQWLVAWDHLHSCYLEYKWKGNVLCFQITSVRQSPRVLRPLFQIKPLGFYSSAAFLASSRVPRHFQGAALKLTLTSDCHWGGGDRQSGTRFLLRSPNIIIIIISQIILTSKWFRLSAPVWSTCTF